MTPDPSLLRAALCRQAESLAPIAARLHVALAHPPIAPHDWHGPASRSYDELEAQLRARIAAADEAVSAALHSTRLALAQLQDGGDPGG